MIEYKITTTNKENMTDEFHMKIEGLAFYFQENNKWVNPFFTKWNPIAKEIFKEGSQLLWNPQQVMNFETNELKIKIEELQ